MARKGSASANMTASEARHFEKISEASATQVMAAFDCGCEPYSDVFTFRRWKAQGFHVRKGEKSFRLATYVKPRPRLECVNEHRWTLKGDGPTDCPTCGRPGHTLEQDRELMPRNVPVFCRHQVEEDGR